MSIKQLTVALAIMGTLVILVIYLVENDVLKHEATIIAILGNVFTILSLLITKVFK